MTETIRVTEIYKSIQGESIYAGWPCVFVRLTGCPLRCRWCDTAYSFEGGEEMPIAKALDHIMGHQTQMVEFTGGEPLAQPSCRALIDACIEQGLNVLIETGGSESIAGLDPSVHVIMDLKPPGSGMTERMNWDNLRHLKPTDEIKFVVADRNDFDWACSVIDANQLETVCKLSASPAFGLARPAEVVDWILDSGKNIRLNMQIHKYIWHPRTKGV